ncbi:MAG: hypothetical protein KGN79_07820 [Acidobacteriota bacterium]|nr:hypothetical protein [Acidobacteriota bacterium]
MPKTELTAASAVSVMRALKASFVVFSFLLIFLAYKLPSQSASAAETIVEFAISAIALVDVALGFFLPGYLMRQPVRPPRGNVQATPVQRWMTCTVLGLAFFESCNLFAFTLHLLGARTVVVGVLFAVGICSMIVWDFGAPPADIPQH